MLSNRCPITALALGLAALGSAGCQSFGVLARKPPAATSAPHPLEAFDTVEVSGDLAARLVPGSACALTVDGPLGSVESRVENGTLFLALKPAGAPAKDPVRVQVTLPELRRLRVARATVTVDGVPGRQLDVAASDDSVVKVMAVKGGRLALQASHRSRLVVDGTADTVTFSLSDGSRGDGRELRVRTARVALAGASRLDLRSEQAVSGEASGGSKVEMWSKPRRLKVATREDASVEYVRKNGAR